jgi:uncharacterized membrane protein YesL
MSPKNKLLSLVIVVTAILVVYFQTSYRVFYKAFPWSVNAYHTVKYPASLKFISPDSQSILMIITGAVIVLIILVYYPKDTHTL